VTPVAMAWREQAMDAGTPVALRLLVVVGVRLYRDGLALALDHDLGFDVVGASDRGEEALALLDRLGPDLVILDMNVPGSLEVARAAAAPGSEARVVALAIPDDPEAVIACAEAGVCAYVPADATLDDLAAALRRAVRGEARCSPSVAAGLMRRVAALAAERPGFPRSSPLTAREEEIVALIDEGLSNKEIGQRLFIEVATVKNHVHNILEKLNVTRRAQAAARMRALRRG
jgi:two-component system, NarL family, nitrate/nitrite response regulator NarL